MIFLKIICLRYAYVLFEKVFLLMTPPGDCSAGIETGCMCMCVRARVHMSAYDILYPLVS